jgi:membrane associated rhomboid family serine protease
MMGHLGQLYRTYAEALRRWNDGDQLAAEALLEKAASGRLPDSVRGDLRVWHLTMLTSGREWSRAVAFYESRFGWGTLGTAMQARLLVARAYAELGQIELALRCLHFVALSPRTIGALERQLWMARVCVAALAGDEVELEALLLQRRGPARFTAYWRGRCALARDDHAEAGKQLARALSLTPRRLQKWREVAAGYLQVAESGAAQPPAAASTVAYRHGQEVLHLAEQQAAGWRALMHWGRPELATLSLLLIISVVFLVDEVVLTGMFDHPLWIWAGNVPEAVRNGEWWRATTALFLHANFLHWAMNSVALWMFGSAVEKAMGRWRFLTVFLVAGTLANLESVWTAHYDVSVGASGGIFAVLGAFVVAVFQLRSPIYAAVRRRLLVLLAVMIAADLTIGGLEPQVDNLAHGGGFLWGLLLGWILRPRAPRQR